MPCQPGILAPVLASGRYVTLSLVHGVAPRELLERLARLRVDDSLVVGIGEPLAKRLGHPLVGLRSFPVISGRGGPVIPSTQAALFLHTRAEDHGTSLRRMLDALATLGDGVHVDEDIAAFKYDIGRDLSGYEDGTENPKGDAALQAAVRPDGGSFVAAQRWVHDLAALARLDDKTRDEAMGRNRETNAELADAPPHAHIKRAQQEAFDPPAFMLRRSMPFGGVREHGLFFVAYVAALDTFERVMKNMSGANDGVVDGLFRFSRPVSGGYYFCPPVNGTSLDLGSLQP
jgi:porphyrinogen peroxidase